MTVLLDVLPWLSAMLVLALLSAFFSASEAAYFSLRGPQRRRLEQGNTAQRLAAGLLEKPDRLLTTVLFCNLIANIAYFAATSLVELEINRHPEASTSLQIAFPTTSVLLLIVFSEMLPKSVGVAAAAPLASAFSVPLGVVMRLVQPLMPLLQTASVLSRRLLWPRFEAESYLGVADLERAIELSTGDANLIDQERTALRGIVGLSDRRVDECMRPRNQLVAFRPPIHRKDLEGADLDGGYLLITESESNEIAGAVRLHAAWRLPAHHLEREAEPVVYCPWCVSVADALQQLVSRDREVVAVINELGETIGVLTMEDILDIAFSDQPGRSERLLKRLPIRPVGEGRWQVEGMANLRRLSEYFQRELPPTHSVTVAGVLQEALQRLPELHDTCTWGPFHMEVVHADAQGGVRVELRLVEPSEESA